MKDDQLCSTRSAFAEGTYKNIEVQWRTFLTFCVYFGFTYLPTSLNTICLYAQFLSRSFKSVDSIKNYISGVKYMHIINDMEFPYLESMTLKLTLKGLFINPHLPKRALPITPGILTEMYKHLEIGKSLDKVFWCLFLIAFFVMSRKSNLVPISISKFDSKKQLTRGDILLENDILIVLVKWSKTIQFGQRILRIPLINIPGNILCPVKAYKDMIKAIPAHKTSPAFCILKEGEIIPIIYKQFQNKLRNLIEKTGRNSKYYSSHSFRRGGASLAFESNVTTELIQLHGDWRSDAYKKYLEFSLEKKLMVSKKMRDEICAKIENY